MDTDTRTALIANVASNIYAGWVIASGNPLLDPAKVCEVAKTIVDCSREAATGIHLPTSGSAAPAE